MQEHLARYEWLGTLKPGDEVGVYEHVGAGGTRFVHTGVVARRTPTGRIVLAEGSVYRRDGSLYTSRTSCYARRHLQPLPSDQPKGTEDEQTGDPHGA